MIKYGFFMIIGLMVVGCALNVEDITPDITTNVITVTAIQTATIQSSSILPSFTPTNSAQPKPSPTPTLTSTPKPPATQVQLTQGGCCVKPFFSADGDTVLFVDKPTDQAPLGIYGVALTTFISPEESLPQLVDEIIGFRSPDQSILAYPDADDGRLMRFIDKTTNETWTIDTLGNWPFFSPDGSRLYWNATDQRGAYDERPTDIWVASVDGSEARVVLTIFGGGANGWFPDNERLLITGREEPIGTVETMTIFSVKDGSRSNLAQSERLRGGTISPNGTWVIYLVTFSGDEAQDGLWVARTDGTHRWKLPFFGPYHWLDDSNLRFIPPRQSAAEGFSLWQVNVETERLTRLTNPMTLPMNIQDGDWAVSDDGKHIVYVSALDQNLWLVTLP